MNFQDFIEQLELAAASEDFFERSQQLTDEWSRSNAGLEAAEAVLRFMEAHPSLDFGMPGPLVHFVEQFHRHGYEEKLLESFSRTPTPHTAWMLNRLINGTSEAARKQLLTKVLLEGMENPACDAETVLRIRQFAARVSK
jgi:hypothetical protein